MKTYKLGDLIETFYQACGIPNLKLEDVSGINRDKEFFEPAKQIGTDTSNYQIVPKGYFACNLMHVGRDVVLPISCNLSETEKIVSPAYTVFFIKDESVILREYFFMMLKSDEKDRFFWFHTDSSVRDGMSWEDFTSLEIELPPIDIQKKYVAVYTAMQRNLTVYQAKFDDLKLVCDGYIEKLRREMPSEEIGTYIRECDERNTMLKELNVQGVESTGSFMETKANTTGLDFNNYKIVKPNQFAYNPSRINVGSLAIKEDNNCIVSPMYVVFEVINQEKLLPLYLMLWLSRSEFRRSTLFYASGSVRDTFNFEEIEKVKIPIPKIEIQQAIIKIYNSYKKRKTIAEKLKAQINSICPVLIKGAISEGE